MPGQPAENILAGDMVHMLLSKLGNVELNRPNEPSYSIYKSTKELCENVFHETYSPDISEVMDSVDKNVITIAKSGNGVGKSHGAARIALSFFLRYDDAQVYTTAAPPESNLDIILWGQIKDVVRKNPETFAPFKMTSGKYIERGPLSFIIGLPIPQSANSHERKARFSGKHAPNIIFILDEGDAIPADIYEAIESCMSGGNVRLLVMFNPRADVGPVSKMEKNGTGRIVQIKAFNHPNVKTNTIIYPGAVDRETTVRRINEWTVPLGPRDSPDSECFEVPDFLVGSVARSHASVPYPPLRAGWRRIINPAFSYMVLAEYPAVGESQLIKSSAIEAALARYDNYVSIAGPIPPRRVRPVMGVDVAEFGLDSTVVTLRYDNFIPPQETWRFTDPDKTATDCADIYVAHACFYANVDANGVGAGVAPRMMRSGCREVYGLKMQSRPDMKALSPEQAELGEFGLLRDYIWWSAKEWIEKDPMSMIPPDSELVEELKKAKYRIKKGRIIVTTSDEFREDIGRSPDKGTSLALSVCDRFEDFAGDLTVESYIYGPGRDSRQMAGVSKGNFGSSMGEW